jgi:transposase
VKKFTRTVLRGGDGGNAISLTRPWKRRLRYGTLICDLERGVPIDLLPDHTVETVSAWLKEHPSIDTVSRDGSSEYASAIKKGAPQAREVSDRWHLVKNLAGCVSVLLAESLAQLRRAAAVANSQQVEHPSGEPQSHPRTRAERQAQQARQVERRVRYEQITALQNQGMKSAEIAAVVGMAERTVRQWLSRGDVPYAGPRKPRASLLDPYKTYLLERWHQGCRNGAQLERELRAKGYTGSQKAEEQESLQQLRQARPQIEVAYQLVEAFLHMVRERTGEQLDAWLGAVQASHLEAFQSFVTGVRQDKYAVLAGLTLPWSTGPVEGQVNRLKLIKRSMYGRAEFDLLKRRVLHHSKKSLERKNKEKQAQQGDHLETPRVRKKNTNPQHTIIDISKVA